MTRSPVHRVTPGAIAGPIGRMGADPGWRRPVRRLAPRGLPRGSAGAGRTTSPAAPRPAVSGSGACPAPPGCACLFALKAEALRREGQDLVDQLGQLTAPGAEVVSLRDHRQRLVGGHRPSARSASPIESAGCAPTPLVAATPDAEAAERLLRRPARPATARRRRFVRSAIIESSVRCGHERSAASAEPNSAAVAGHRPPVAAGDLGCAPRRSSRLYLWVSGSQIPGVTATASGMPCGAQRADQRAECRAEGHVRHDVDDVGWIAHRQLGQRLGQVGRRNAAAGTQRQRRDGQLSAAGLRHRRSRPCPPRPAGRPRR